MRRSGWVMSLVILYSYGSSQANTIVDFEDWAGGDSGVLSLDSHGFHFEIPSGASLQVLTGGGTNNSTHRLFLRFTNSMTMTRVGGGLFDINSLDLQEGFSSPYSTSVTINGFFPGSGSISQAFTLDDLSNTYQTFSSSGFSGLDHAVLQGTAGFSIDNIIVPEPSAVIFVLVGLFFSLYPPNERLFD